MEPNNIPRYKSATNPGPLTAQAASLSGKPPKIYARPYMEPPKASRVISEPCQRDYTPVFFGKQRMMGWAIGFLIAVIVVLCLVINRMHADVNTALKTRVAELEKQIAERVVRQQAQYQPPEQWEEYQAQEKKARIEVKAKPIERVESQEIVQNEIVDLHRKINDMEKQLTSQQQWVSALQDTLSKERKAQQELIAKAEKKVREETDAKAKRVAAGLEQQKAADQIRAELAREKQARAESEARIAEANQAHMAAAQAVAGLKQKLVEGEKQAQDLEQQGKILAQRQAELNQGHKLGVEVEACLQQAAVVKTAAEQDMAAINARLTEVSQITATAQEQVKQLQAGQAEIDKEKQRQKSLFQSEVKTCEAVQAAEKVKADSQVQADAQAGRVAAGLEQQKAADQIRAELVREKQARAESEAKIAEANQAHAAAAQAVAGLEQKLVEGEKQAQDLEQQGKILAQRQAELRRVRKLSAE